MLGVIPAVSAVITIFWFVFRVLTFFSRILIVFIHRGLTGGVLRGSRIIYIGWGRFINTTEEWGGGFQNAVGLKGSPPWVVRSTVVLVLVPPFLFAPVRFAVKANNGLLPSSCPVIVGLCCPFGLAVSHNLRWNRRVVLLFIIIIPLFALDTGLGRLIVWQAVVIEFRSPDLNIVFITRAVIRLVLRNQLSILLFMTFSLSYRMILISSSAGKNSTKHECCSKRDVFLHNIIIIILQERILIF